VAGVTGVPVARILGIEIRVQLGWVIVLALIGVIAVGQVGLVAPDLEGPLTWVLGGVVAIGFFVSSVAHDLAHALVARRRGIDVAAIAVSFFGGATPLDPTAENPSDDLAIAASGPLVSLAIGVGLLVVTLTAATIEGGFGPAPAVLTVLVFLNLVLGLVNLVPAYPLDGGRIVRALAWRYSGSERSGWGAAALSGRVSGIVTIVIGLVVLFLDDAATGAMIALTGWFLILSSNALRSRLRLDDLVSQFRVSDAMEPDPATIQPNLTVDTFADQLLDGESAMTAVPVVHDDQVVGLLGVGQVRRLRRRDWLTTRVEDVMARPPKLTVLRPDQPLKRALDALQGTGLDGLPVVEEGGRLIGVLTRRSLGRLLTERIGREALLP
jgi:Zn-dependent protease/CBS domain-containing protein